ncbi:hypothetical protein SISNIDRAFT_471235 [Sistotremastrum niveocremeum HHB9708]|uniref:Uncharacterized protein n=2 Tax=Sistotremastraceae TaxID=3402574 RepID=A0A164MXF9_9AGAM|nr:hypothetical protein SISNIDRAFT_471235 [Sistotremastrum niveocremeum HHB9708]KZT30998.1 hypothetical protein SISSUDRAFT_1068263 [Sistotremastrum suecicum HHB10207 ss-3]
MHNAFASVSNTVPDVVMLEAVDSSDVVMFEIVDAPATQHTTIDIDMMECEEEEAGEVEMREIQQEVKDVEMRGQDISEDVEMVDVHGGDAVMGDLFEETVEGVEDGHHW